MRLLLILKIGLMLLVFIAADSLVRYLAEVIPGTPTHNLGNLTDGQESVSARLAALNSSEGIVLLRQHNNWIVLIFLPVAAVCSAFSGRFMKVAPKAIFIAVCVFVFAVHVAMLFNPLARENPLGYTLDSASGASYLASGGSVVLCIALAALVSYWFPSGRTASPKQDVPEGALP